MHIKSIAFLLVFLFSLLPQIIEGQDLVYKPKNPAFGGDTFNYNWLLNSANAQDPYDDPDENTEFDYFNREENQLDDFTSSLNRQLLSQLSRTLVSDHFGEDGLSPGSYVIGDFSISVVDIGDGISITIFDASTGNETQVIIPYY